MFLFGNGLSFLFLDIGISGPSWDGKVLERKIHGYFSAAKKWGFNTHEAQPMAHGAHGDVLRSITSPDAWNLTHGPWPISCRLARDSRGQAEVLDSPFKGPAWPAWPAWPASKFQGNQGNRMYQSFPSFQLDIFLGLSTDMPRYAPSWV